MITQPRCGRRYELDGEQLTLTEIHALVPCMSMTAIRNGLAKGYLTKRQLLTADMRRGRVAKCRAPQFGSAVR
jgi:hypothetical protein